MIKTLLKRGAWIVVSEPLPDEVPEPVRIADKARLGAESIPQDQTGQLRCRHDMHLVPATNHVDDREGVLQTIEPDRPRPRSRSGDRCRVFWGRFSHCCDSGNVVRRSRGPTVGRDPKRSARRGSTRSTLVQCAAFSDGRYSIAMWRSIYELIVWPILAVFTARVQGVRASRNPLHWLPLWAAAVIVVPLLVLLYPVYLLSMLARGWSLMRFGADARIADAGMEVFSKSRGPIAFHAWNAVSSASLRFEPPGWCAQITLASGEVVPLPLADFEVIATACEAHGIPVDRTRGFGSGEPTDRRPA